MVLERNRLVQRLSHVREILWEHGILTEITTIAVDSGVPRLDTC